MCKIISHGIPASPPQTTSLDEEFNSWYQTLNLETDLYKLPFGADAVAVKADANSSNSNDSRFIPFYVENTAEPREFESFPAAASPEFPSSLFPGGCVSSIPLFPSSSATAQPAIFSDFSIPNDNSLIPGQGFDSSVDWFSTVAAATNDSLPANTIISTEAPFINQSEKSEKSPASATEEESSLRSKKRKQPSSQTMTSGTPITTASATEDIPEALAVKRQKQNEAARKSRQKKQTMIKDAQDRAEKAEQEVDELKKRLEILESEKASFAAREAEMKKKFEALLQRADHFGTSSFW